MKYFVLLISLLLITLTSGCVRARVDVGGTEKPIKVDVTMRVDIYQHVVEEIDSIENMVRSGKPTKTEAQPEPQSLLNLFCKNVWAAELSPAASQAVEGRKARLSKVNELLASGAIGENNQGLLEIKSGGRDAQEIVSAENADREIIYKSLAEQNNATIESIKQIYAEKMQNLAPAGSPVQDAAGSWKTK